MVPLRTKYCILVCGILLVFLVPAFSQSTSSAEKNVECDFEALVQLQVSPISQLTSNKYRKSEAEFRKERRQKNRKDRAFFGRIQREPIAYRYDFRSPEEIVADNGFWPNPAKPEGTLEQHTDVATGDYSEGSGSYVSLTWESNIMLLRNEGAPIQEKILPSSVQIDGEWKPISSEDWQLVLEKRARSPIKPTDAIWKLYEYQLTEVVGTRVHGGFYQFEKELITRGVPFSSNWRVREVTVKVPLSYRQFSSFLDMAKSQPEFGGWKPLPTITSQ